MLRNKIKNFRSIGIGLLASASIFSFTTTSFGLERTLEDIDYSKNGSINCEDLFYISNHWNGNREEEKSSEELIYLIENWKSEYELPTRTLTATQTSTFTPTFTNTNSFTSTNTETSTLIPTSIATKTNTITSTLTETSTLINTETPTLSSTKTNTITNTPTKFSTSTPTNTPTLTSTPTPYFTAIPLEIRMVDIPGLPKNARKMKMIKIPSGEFIMGGLPNEQYADDWDYPQHNVIINYNFYLGETEVTQAQWFSVMGKWPSKSSPSERYGIGDNNPIYFVSWKEAKDFMNELNKLGQGNFRFPSEAEFEYAHRSRTTTRFFFGDSLDCVDRIYLSNGQGWDDVCEDCPDELGGTRADYAWSCFNSNKTQEVGRKIFNQFGLYDISGNVSEWCEDSFHLSYDGAPNNGSAWVDPEATDTSFRVNKGGAFNFSPLYLRSAKRMAGKGALQDVGFRVVSDE